MSTITVLVAPRLHPVSQRATRCKADATAAALALGLGIPLRLLSAGSMSDSVGRDYLALGAPLLEILQCAEDAPILQTLLPALRDVSWVLTGTRSEADQGTGMLPYTLAAALGRPLVTDVLAVQADGAAWIVTQALPKGARRRLRVQAPAVLAVSTAAPLLLRHSLADAATGQIVRTAVAPVSPAPPLGQLVPANKRRQLLEARVVQSGHTRMLGAIESPSTGGAVIQTGTPDTKAQAVLDYLRRHSLVNF
ncbi:MAG: electron transfer flavoprotein subunit beta [Pseudomonadota bacterium]